MSSSLANSFGEIYQEDYSKIVSKWSKKLVNSGKITPETRSEWGLDLQGSLGDSVINGLIDHVLPKWKKAGPLPSTEVLNLYTKIAVKGALAVDTGDLLQRLKNSSSVTTFTTSSINTTTSSFTFVNATTLEPNSSGVTLGYSTYNPVSIGANTTAEFAVATPELVKRAAQTVSQIFDMAQDRFDNLMSKHFKRTNQATGQRRWVTVASKSGGPSRHAILDGVIKSEDELFSIGGEKVYGPRPPGGDPARWSNCSCKISFETSNGNWV